MDRRAEAMRFAVTPSDQPSDPIGSYMVIVVSSDAAETKEASHRAIASDGASHLTPVGAFAWMFGSRLMLILLFPPTARRRYSCWPTSAARRALRAGCIPARRAP